MVRSLKAHLPILKPMFDLFEKLDHHGQKLSTTNYYVMGQICIAADHRGTGVFGALYNKHKDLLSDQFDLCLTEVASGNPRSMRAHEKVGFKIVHSFQDNHEEWNVIAWDWKLR